MAKSLTILLLLLSLKGFSQSLTIEETITYLNKLSAEHPGTWYYEKSADALLNAYDECKNEITYKITYDNKSKISVQEIKKRYNCKTSIRNITMNGSLFTFDVTDFDVNEIELRMDKYNNDIVLKGDIAKTEFDSSINKYSRFGVLTKYAYLSVTHKGYLKVLYNGMKYLISLAKSQVPKEEIEVIDDPFVTKENKSKNNTITSQSKVTLSEQNGVTSLTVTVGGKITSKFILDSGAGDCNISSELEKKLLANGIIKKTDYLENGLYKLADGSIVENRRINIPKLKVGNKTISNVIVSVGPFDSPNLLGQSFLKKLNKWSIDNSKKILTIE
ncbi:MAG: hypothetical protein E6Q39_02135 [Crocinitomicaceae bacterium]|nr:MAG: hypothetical protein E6Q39_02135 [Crocinitomicaceae bacterium]